MQSAPWGGFRHEHAFGAAATRDRSRSKGGSWEASTPFLARIGAMNPHPPFGHPLPLGGGEGRGEGAVHGKGGLPKTAIDCAHEPESIAIGRSDAQHGRCELWSLCARWKDWLWCAACKLFGDAHE